MLSELWNVIADIVEADKNDPIGAVSAVHSQNDNYGIGRVRITIIEQLCQNDFIFV
ncbi:MAG: hypothetical protein WA461_04650 [Nitrososphaeraceae archaeon]